MDWIKVAVRHGEFDFAGASDAIFRTWIRMMLYVAVLERLPTEKQLVGHLGEKNYRDLEAYLDALGNGTVTRYIMDKVLEDVSTTQHNRATGKVRQRIFREKHREEPKSNAVSNALCNAYVTGADKIRLDKIREDKTKKSYAFLPPSIDEVKAYVDTRKNKIDPSKFVNFYESKGWMVGKNKMKNWKAAVRTWETSDEPTVKKLSFKTEVF